MLQHLLQAAATGAAGLPHAPHLAPIGNPFGSQRLARISRSGPPLAMRPGPRRQRAG